MKFGTGEADSEMISQSMSRNEMILTRLRLTQGLNLSEFSKTYHEDLLESKSHMLEKWRGKILISNGNLQITREGWALTDEISSDLMSLPH